MRSQTPLLVASANKSSFGAEEGHEGQRLEDNRVQGRGFPKLTDYRMLGGKASSEVKDVGEMNDTAGSRTPREGTKSTDAGLNCVGSV